MAIYANIVSFLFCSQSVSGSDGGSAPEMMSAALIVSDEPQRHIPSEDLDKKYKNKNKTNNYKYNNKIPNYIILLLLEISTI